MSALTIRPIPDFPLYGATGSGDVVFLETGLPARSRLNETGYLRMSLLSSYGEYKEVFKHRAVAMAWHGMPEPHKPCVAHLNGSRTDNRPCNLAWVSYKENEAHKVAHGTVVFGERSKQAKLTEKKVVEMRSRRQSGASYRTIGREFGVSNFSARHAVLGITWKHVKSNSARALPIQQAPGGEGK